MAKIRFEIAECSNISIRAVASEVGFNLNSINLRSEASQMKSEIVKRIVSQIVCYLEEAWEEKFETTLSEVQKGVYIIRLSGDLSIEYKNGNSKILYIGKGKIRERIKAHLQYWLLEVAESLQDISCDFQMMQIKVRKNSDAYSEVESDLLYAFYEKFGELPLQNEQSGKNHSHDHSYGNDIKGIIGQSVSNGWAIKPLKRNESRVKKRIVG